MEYATFGGGCFWCLEALYDLVIGISSVTSGYSGGSSDTVDYQSLHTGSTGHAEVIQIQFDPSVISYEEVLKIFFASHDPTTHNQQGADIGPQYRSIILFHNQRQKTIAQQIASGFAQDLWDDPIVTEIKKFEAFYPAEEYHQNYYKNNQDAGYCQIVINPKLAKFRKDFAKYLKDS